MMRNNEIIQRFYNEIWNQGYKEVAKELIASDLQFRGSTGISKNGIAPFLEYVDLIRGALSGYRCIIEEIVSEGDSAFAKMTFTGMHTGRFFGVAPTNKEISWTGAALFKFHDEKIYDLWVLGDIDGLKYQLGMSEKISP